MIHRVAPHYLNVQVHPRLQVMNYVNCRPSVCVRLLVLVFTFGVLLGSFHSLYASTCFSTLSLQSSISSRKPYLHEASANHSNVSFVYPNLQGGLGNQLFVMSAACLLASQTGRRIVVNARQTGVYSYGVPQPTFWQTVFFSDFFHKD